MKYLFDLPDFKAFLHDKNEKYRVDGLIFWQNRIPIPIDLFNRIFEDSDSIIRDYIYHITCAVIVFAESESFEQMFNLKVTDLPSSKLEKRLPDVREWLKQKAEENGRYINLPVLISRKLDVESLSFDLERLAEALTHQGKKYKRLAIPSELRDLVSDYQSLSEVGEDNTDMIGNIIADRYNIYRSGFSDALAIIFNALIEFKILCSGNSTKQGRIKLSIESSASKNIKIKRTKDGSLWEAAYDNDHCLILNNEHPYFKKLDDVSYRNLSELLFLLAEFENNQFSDSQRKLIENMRQEVSRTLWINNDN